MGIEQFDLTLQEMLAGSASVRNDEKKTHLANADVISVDMNSLMMSVYNLQNNTGNPDWTPRPSYVLETALIKYNRMFSSSRPHSCIALMFDDGTYAPELRKVMHADDRYAPASDKKINEYRSDGRLAPPGVPYEEAITHSHYLAEDGRVYQTERRPYELPHEVASVIQKIENNEVSIDWNRVYSSKATKGALLGKFYQEALKLASIHGDRDKHSVIVWRDKEAPAVWPTEKDLTEHPDYVQRIYENLVSCKFGEADERVVEAIRPAVNEKNVVIVTGDKDMWAQCLSLGSRYIQTDFPCPQFSVLFTRTETINLNMRKLMRMYGCYDEQKLEDEDAFYIDADIAEKHKKAKKKREILPRVIGKETPKPSMMASFATEDNRACAQLLCVAFLITSYGADYCRKTKLTYFGLRKNGTAKLIQRIPTLHHTKFWIIPYENVGYAFNLGVFFIILQGIRAVKGHEKEVDLFVDMLCRLLYNFGLFRAVGRERHNSELKTGGGPDFESIVNAVNKAVPLSELKERPEKEQTVSTLLTMPASTVCVRDDGMACLM